MDFHAPMVRMAPPSDQVPPTLIGVPASANAPQTVGRKYGGSEDLYSELPPGI